MRTVAGIDVDSFTSAPLLASVSVICRAAPESVWRTIVDPDLIPKWVVFARRAAYCCESGDPVVSIGPGAIRKFNVFKDFDVRERVEVWEPPRILGYRTLDMWIPRDQLGLFIVDAAVSGDTRISCYQFVNIPALLRPVFRLLLPVVFKWVLGRIARAAAAEEGRGAG
ncbi:MAG: SRPBCC family protein [Chloroflexi bacterium]|nr:SRPBCC family protein [Chloroflexota bacterium]MCY3938820.1 SRPBCC family protein [Chloroflexota bacterium]